MKLPLNTYSRALLMSLGMSLTTFCAQATSPTKPEQLTLPTAVSYSVADYQADEATKMFPVPTEGLVQHILTLPQLTNEEDYRLEIAIGRSEEVDCNKHGLSGEITQHTVKGWGYNYYQVDTIRQGPSTMMACFDKAKKTAFLTLPEKLTLAYDSRLPKVFYLPAGAQIRYRIWQASGDYHYSEAK
ncbi:serine protease inhibitor ecotin [Shewanella insulae]|uniref:serine protease inhibitor ecotin n=1 Tax=Shewanella insulae TaxID=2681496 RepID=UPI001EFC7461|nr:serine protease inhibitor ecotin [Shewanella insulae]MCG9736722.1 serine protease inhibitor ecotin [Shewanella insulae]MCG9755618.1 serine protease inhibitor ecotin [Shewanella insulae]